MHRYRFAILASILSCTRPEARPLEPAPALPSPAPALLAAPPPEPAPEVPDFGPLDPNDPGGRVLIAGRKIAYVERRIFTAGCWNFVDAVFGDAGYPKGKRYTVFQGKHTGPWAKVDLLRPGDWVMHRNAETGGGEHSAIFVRWENRSAKMAVVLDYVGMKRPTTGSLGTKDLSRVYTIVRAGRRSK